VSRACFQEPSPAPKKLVTNHLKNVIRVHESLFSGALPETDASFEELKQLGIKTIMSVDGMVPNVALAKKHGMQYVHLPLGYDGISRSRAIEIAFAIRTIPKPIYLHCHHGKHRSAAAAASGCLSLGLVSRENANRVLSLAGTNPGFRGLYDAVANASPFSDAELESSQIVLSETSPVPAIAESMTSIDATFDSLKRECDRKDGINPTDCANQCLLLREHYMELGRLHEVKRMPQEFHRLREHGETILAKLESEFRRTAVESIETKSAKDALIAIETNCKECHVQFRDAPRISFDRNP
jgi:protein tyrosine phosphatase (PTP) superfamily phosphohydrolase (DUF442 family)